jgi:hypothetical protein
LLCGKVSLVRARAKLDKRRKKMTSEYTAVRVSTIGAKFAVTDYKGQQEETGGFPKTFDSVLDAVAFAEANKKSEQSEVVLNRKAQEALNAAKGVE